MILSGVRAELLEFCQPWLAGEPRLLLASQFAPAGESRERFLAINVLMRELAQSVIAVSEHRVAEARLAWWADEAQSWAGGHPRHPLAHGFDHTSAARPLASLVAVCGQWLLAAAPASAQDLQRQLVTLADACGQLYGNAPVWRLPWLSLVLRMTWNAKTPLTSVVPMDIWAKHGLTRSQWAELASDRRNQLFADLLQQMQVAPQSGAAPALAALQYLESRWLAAAGKWSLTGERISWREVFGVWRVARQAQT